MKLTHGRLLKSLQQRMLSNRHYLNEEEEHDDLSRAMFYWWRSASKFDQCVKLKWELPDISKISPTCKILREMERIAAIASEGLHELRQKLLTYRSGDLWLPIGGLEKTDVEIPAMNTILLVGFKNAGKSSLVNLMYSVLGQSGVIPFTQTSQTSSGNTSVSPSPYASLFMEEHNVLRSPRSGFCVYDTRGFDYGDADEALDQFSRWMTEGVHHGQHCLRSSDCIPDRDALELHSTKCANMFTIRRVNCVMLVINLEEIREAVRIGDMKPLDVLAEVFRMASVGSSTADEHPILILTHGDKLSTEDRIFMRLKICEALGANETNGTYDIVCSTEYGFLPDEIDLVTAYALSEAVYRALIISDRGHLSKTSLHDWLMFLVAWFMCGVGRLFGVIAHFFSSVGEKKKLKWAAQKNKLKW
ncbi:OLC1v1003692C1 [Oldenlandia corymbosa var. corymbosa]|uniref:OLC1v1003692C1 n=1 Tax=Oldenlandia corymbosa var. corymbosa TaxID=529605 RepID=A0AAV1DAL7_OLDCO|nr:OLC1v1003692C1 [Oldenlandia corymbosa var. corymbosa]